MKMTRRYEKKRQQCPCSRSFFVTRGAATGISITVFERFILPGVCSGKESRVEATTTGAAALAVDGCALGSARARIRRDRIGGLRRYIYTVDAHKGRIVYIGGAR